MDLISNVKVYGIEDSVKASKYPMSVNISNCNDEITKTVKSLAGSKIGEGHDNWLNGIIVQFDLNFTVKAWVEAERYHFFDFISSQSTIHRITKFDLNNSYIEYVDQRIIDIMKEKVNNYNHWLEIKDTPQNGLNITKKELNERLSEMYLEILYSNPCGFQLTARMTTNYRQLKTIYFQRKAHKLPEWKIFCSWCESLPYFKEFFLEGDLNS